MPFKSAACATSAYSRAPLGVDPEKDGCEIASGLGVLGTCSPIARRSMRALPGKHLGWRAAVQIGGMTGSC